MHFYTLCIGLRREWNLSASFWYGGKAGIYGPVISWPDREAPQSLEHATAGSSCRAHPESCPDPYGGHFRTAKQGFGF